MAKDAIIYVCRDCGNEYLKWQGRCDVCKAWNTLEEFKTTPENKSHSSSRLGGLVKPLPLVELANKPLNRIKTTIDEIDRVFGGGLVPGSIVLLSGEPGIGKSTLLLELIRPLSTKKITYWTAEESPEQVAARAKRLGITNKNIAILADNDANQIQNFTDVDLLIIDSIQTIVDFTLPGSAGSVAQVRSVLSKIQAWVKTRQTVVIIVGHVTKEGEVAGPKTLEHMVDVVTLLEGDQNHMIRLLTGTKNRFGATNEVGVFTMTEAGLEPVTNPSKLFLAERLTSMPGSVVTATIEGTRPFLVEIQALATKSYLPFPKRTASGIDQKRFDLICAVLEKRAKVALYNQDIFINVVGGMRITEPAADLAIALAIASTVLQIPIPEDWCVYGELGLGGEIRSVKNTEARRKEVTRLGYLIPPQVKTIADAVSLLKK